MPEEGGELLHVGRMLIELDPVLAEYEFERDGFTLKQKGDTQTVTIALTRDLAQKGSSMSNNERDAQEKNPNQMSLAPAEPEGDE